MQIRKINLKPASYSTVIRTSKTEDDFLSNRYELPTILSLC